MQLKDYQTETLTVLRRYLELARAVGPKNAYQEITAEPEQKARLGRYAGAYKPLEALPDVPYVCLRLPTGGGKTILAAHAIPVARDAWIEKEYPMVLWLAPSSIIQKQTVEALKKSGHPYREALNDAFGGYVRVFDIADFTHLRPYDLRQSCCVVVGAIQALRVKDTVGRKVYAHHEDVWPHFERMKPPPDAPGLERLENGQVKCSFVNLMHIHRPLMIVDEAHNAISELTREVQARINPCAVIEFTATPRDKKGQLYNNILHSVSAQELKLEQMIKLPIILSENDTWQNTVNRAVAARASLAERAKEDRDYIRPIVLFQAQDKNQDVTVEVLKRHLMDVERVPEERIAVATGAQRELDGVNLHDRACPIEYVITVEALKEGWDCPFAYVFCSVARIHSAKDVEQLLGRVLRMPYAQRRKAPELNRAYAFLSEPEFGAAARALKDRLVAMGFEEDEAQDNIEPAQPVLGGDTGLFAPREKPKPVFRHTVDPTPDLLALLDERRGEGVETRETDDGRVEITVTGGLKAELEKSIGATLPKSRRAEFEEAVEIYRVDAKDLLSPAELGAPFLAPRLMASVQGQLEIADNDTFMEYSEWSPLDFPAVLTEREFDIHESARSFEIDIDGAKVKYQFTSEQEQLALDVPVEGWTPEALAIWLAPRVRAPDLRHEDLLKWLRDLTTHLTGARGLHISALMRCKFILARRIRAKMDEFRRMESMRMYQHCLFGPEAAPDISFDDSFVFREGMYWDQKRYRGSWKPSKHFLGPDNVPAFDGAEDGEEFQCAQAIDSLPGLAYWLRNVARHPNSFWLPTAMDKFYPDFVAQLADGRTLVVEYKGAHIADSADTNEKRTIGELWERMSDGRGLFVVVEKSVKGRDARRQLLDKIGAA